jgi:hypothetical protein
LYGLLAEAFDSNETYVMGAGSFPTVGVTGHMEEDMGCSGEPLDLPAIKWCHSRWCSPRANGVSQQQEGARIIIVPAQRLCFPDGLE